MEIYRLISYEECRLLHERMRFFKRDKSVTEFVCTSYVDDGILILMRRCTENERKKKGSYYGFKLTVILTPARATEKKTNINHINDYESFLNSVLHMRNKLDLIFENIVDSDDFVFSRIDITKDFNNIPEYVIKEYIQLLRRMSYKAGYSFNSSLENNCLTFRPEDSINLVNESRAVEFVVYNKYRAAIDQNYPEADQEFYKDTMRIELRCKRKFVKKVSAGLTLFEAMMCFYKYKDKIIQNTFESIFLHDMNCCFLTYKLTCELINRLMDGKKQKKKKMKKLVSYLNNNPDKSLNDALLSVFSSNKIGRNILNAFSTLKISPLTVASEELSYVQSLSSLLGLKIIERKELDYCNLAHIKYPAKHYFLSYKTC